MVKPLNEGVTVPDQPCSTVQLYWPEELEVVQVPPLVAVKFTPANTAPLAVVVPLTVTGGPTVKLLLIASSVAPLGVNRRSS